MHILWPRQCQIDPVYTKEPFPHLLAYQINGINGEWVKETRVDHCGGRLFKTGALEWQETGRRRLIQVDFVYDAQFCPRSLRCFSWCIGHQTSCQYSQECAVDEAALVAALRDLYQKAFH